MDRFIRKLQSYSPLTPGEIAAIKDAVDGGRPVAAHKLLIHPDSGSRSLLVMLDGWAMHYTTLATGSRQILAFLLPGEAFDTRAHFGRKATDYVEAITPATVSVLSGETLDSLYREHPGFARAMAIANVVEQATLRAWIVGLGRQTATERTAHLILELYHRAIKSDLVVANTLEFPLTQAIIADALGLTSVHLNRILQALRRAGAIHLRNGRLKILDSAMLARMADFDAGYLLG